MKRNNKIIFSGKLLKLSVQKISFPNGHVTEIEKIKHPGAALIVPFMDNNNIIFIKQFRPVISSYIYELPAGTLEPKEPILTCAKRELIEETGYNAKIIRKIGYIYPVPGYSTEKIHIFKAEKLIKIKKDTQPDEVIKTIILSKNKIKKLFKNKKIVDAKTICALAMCKCL